MDHNVVTNIKNAWLSQEEYLQFLCYTTELEFVTYTQPMVPMPDGSGLCADTCFDA